VISKEYSCEWKLGMEPYYPINDETNKSVYEKYKALSEKESRVIFGGRLAQYAYFDMDRVVEEALKVEL
jgi:UDP-galactopyranose mutase